MGQDQPRRRGAGKIKSSTAKQKYAVTIFKDIDTYLQEGALDMAWFSLLNARRIIKELEKNEH